jgi:hypothetical protein
VAGLQINDETRLIDRKIIGVSSVPIPNSEANLVDGWRRLRVVALSVFIDGHAAIVGRPLVHSVPGMGDEICAIEKLESPDVIEHRGLKKDLPSAVGKFR